MGIKEEITVVFSYILEFKYVFSTKAIMVVNSQFSLLCNIPEIVKVVVSAKCNSVCMNLPFNL